MLSFYYFMYSALYLDVLAENYMVLNETIKY